MKRTYFILAGLLSAALGGVMAEPVSLYTGTPDINIPVYTIEVGDYKLPVTLNYNASGIKVSQESSRVGLGWSVSAGGAIHRVIRGYDDFESLQQQQKGKVGKRNPYWTDTEAFTTNKLYSENAIHPDGEPDIFQYDFAGYKGTFVAQRGAGAKNIANKWLLFNTEDNLKVTYDDGIFTIQSPEGVTYTFSEQKRSFNVSRTVPNSTYSFYKVFTTQKSTSRLTERDRVNTEFQEYILNYLRDNAPEGTLFSLDDVILLFKAKGVSYTQKFFTNMEFLEQSQPFCPDQNAENDAQLVKQFIDYRTSKSSTTFVPALLARLALGYKEIATEQGFESTTDWYLTSISLPSGEKLTLTYDIKTNSYCSPLYKSSIYVREMLKDGSATTIPYAIDDDSALQTGTTGTVSKEVTVPFDLQNYNYFIYNQIITARQPLLRKISWDDGYVEFMPSGTIRKDIRPYRETINPSYTSMALYGIKVYSTKSGQLSLHKFRHSYFTTTGAKSGTPTYLTHRLRLDSITVYGTTSASCVGYRFNYDVSQNMPVKNSTVCDQWGYNGLGVSCLCYKATENHTSVSGNKYLESGIRYCHYHGANHDCEYEDMTGIDEEKAKAWVLTDVKDILGGKTHYDYECHKILVDGEEKPVGGLRVKRIVSPTETQEFIYDVSVAKQLRSPLYAYPFMEYYTTNGNCYTYKTPGNVSTLKTAIDKLYSDHKYMNSKYGLVYTTEPLQPWESLCNGGYIGYGKVEIHTLGEGENNYQKEYFTFNNSAETTMTRFDKVGTHLPRNGKPATHYVFRKTDSGIFQQVYRKVYTYGRATGSYVQGIVNYGYAQGARYTLYGYRDYLASTSEYTAGTGSTTSKCITTTYTYNTQNYLPSSITTKQTNGPTKCQEYTYAVDYPTANKALESLNASHNVNLQIDNCTSVNGVVVQKNVFVHDNEDTPHKPSKVYEFTGRESIPTTSVLLSGKSTAKPRMNYVYNSKGRLTSFTSKGGQPAVFIWGYSNRHIIAEISGATLEEVQAALPLDMEELAQKTAPTTAEFTTIKSLRTKLPNAEVVVREYKPMIGVTRATDDYNYILNYTYDRQRRLEKVAETKDSKTQCLIQKNLYNYDTEL